MKERFYRFMVGRYGSDDLNRFITVLFVIAAVIGLFFSGTVRSVTNIICFLLLGLSIFRMLSRNTYKRSSENSKYLNYRRRLFTWAKNIKERFVQRKDFKFFTCPGCKATLRVPRGHGKIEIVCRRCGRKFIGKS